MQFSKVIRDKIKNYLVKVCKVNNPTEDEILESCQSLYYIGRAYSKYQLINQGLKGKGLT